jgi:hypothetical protein
MKEDLSILPRYVAAPDAARLIGASVRQVSYWRQNYAPATGPRIPNASMESRMFTPREVVGLAVLLEAKRLEFTAQEFGPLVAEIVRALPETYEVIDGLTLIIEPAKGGRPLRWIIGRMVSSLGRWTRIDLGAIVQGMARKERAAGTRIPGGSRPGGLEEVTKITGPVGEST